MPVIAGKTFVFFGEFTCDLLRTYFVDLFVDANKKKKQVRIKTVIFYKDITFIFFCSRVVVQYTAQFNQNFYGCSGSVFFYGICKLRLRMVNYDGLSKSEIQKLKNFCRRSQKNEFMQNFVFERDSRICYFCHKPIDRDRLVLHHLTYEHACKTDLVISVFRPTEKRPSRFLKMPDCHSCFENTFPVFMKCSSLLVAAHRHCHGWYHTHPDAEF